MFSITGIEAGANAGRAAGAAPPHLGSYLHGRRLERQQTGQCRRAQPRGHRRRSAEIEN